MELDLNVGNRRERVLPATGDRGNTSLLTRVRKVVCNSLELAQTQLQSTLPSCTITLARDNE